MVIEKPVISDTHTAVNHHSWAAEGWRQLVTSPTNFRGLQQISLVNFDVSSNHVGAVCFGPGAKFCTIGLKLAGGPERPL